MEAWRLADFRERANRTRRLADAEAAKALALDHIEERTQFLENGVGGMEPVGTAIFWHGEKVWEYPHEYERLGNRRQMPHELPGPWRQLVRAKTRNEARRAMAD